MSTQVMATAETSFEAVQRLGKDLRKAATTLSKDEARFLVDSYYQQQSQRIRTAAQVRSMTTSGEPHDVLRWFNTQSENLEGEVGKALDAYSNGFVLGRWARSQYGIGPVIAAGLLAHIDIEKAPTAGAIWRYAGLDPSAVWAKGQKRPWNAALKVLCWKIGQSFIKTSNREGDVYGHLLIARKELLTAQNLTGKFAPAAAEVLSRTPKHAQAAIYSTGQLSPGHILSRASRYAVKLFLAHFQHVAFELKYGVAPPKPYILTADQGHTHMILPPNWPEILSEKGMDKLKKLP